MNQCIHYRVFVLYCVGWNARHIFLGTIKYNLENFIYTGPTIWFSRPIRLVGKGISKPTPSDHQQNRINNKYRQSLGSKRREVCIVDL